MRFSPAVRSRDRGDRLTVAGPCRLWNRRKGSRRGDAGAVALAMEGLKTAPPAPVAHPPFPDDARPAQ